MRLEHEGKVSGETLLAMLSDEKMPDETILETMKEYTADEIDEIGDVIPLTVKKLDEFAKISEEAYRLRPTVMKSFKEWFLQQHGSCFH